jgi:putative transposase
MASKRHTAKRIFAKLQQVDVLMAQGLQVTGAVRAIGVTEVTYYRWRNEFGGVKGSR